MSQSRSTQLPAPSAPVSFYASNTSRPEVDVLNAATCHAGSLAGCTPIAEIPVGHPMANVGAVDDTTRTLYVADPQAGTVTVIGTAACSARDTAGCAAKAAVIKIGPAVNTPVVNPVTRSLYVSYGKNANQVAVVNAADCNAARTSGCGQTPSVAKVADGTVFLGVSTAADTIYAPGSGMSFSGHTMSVINGATCNGPSHSGCSHLAATVPAGAGPFGGAVNDR